MNKIERHGIGGICDRELSLLELPDLYSLPTELSLPGPHFACLIALDAQVVETEPIAAFAETLLLKGAVYVCAWGPDCERVHDIFDEEIVGGGPEVPRFDIGVMTTWHAEEDLDEALWFLLALTYPDDSFFDTCCSALVIAVGNPAWGTRTREVLSNSGEFCRTFGNRDCSD